MPRLSNLGNIGMGIAGIQGSVDGTLIPDLLGPYWINQDHVVCIHNSDFGIWLYNPFTNGRAKLDVRAANELAAGGNIWAAWLSGYGLYSSSGLHLPQAGLLDVGPDGAIGYTVDRQNDIFGCNVYETDGANWNLTQSPVAELQLLGSFRAIWRDFNFNFNTVNLPPFIILPGTKWHPHAIFINNEWWLLYLSADYGLVLHPFQSTVGYRITPPSNFIYHPDGIALNQDTIRVAWSITNGEASFDYVIVDTNIFLQPRIELLNNEPIPVIGKDCWLTWFEFNQPPPVNPPGNSLIKVRYEDSGSIIKLNGERFATWVDGASVEEINIKIQESNYPCVVYWDGRKWPEWPILRPQDWLCVYGYCYWDESIPVFESELRQLVESAQQRYNKVAVNCQCYLSASVPNPPKRHLTNNLKGLVPVYARIARDYPSITMLTVFSDQNRATGLNDNPELRPYWNELYQGITGEPSMSDPDILPEDIFNTLVALRPKYPNPMGNHAAELLNEAAWIHRNQGWGLESKNGGNVCPQPETGITCGCDILRLTNSGYDCLINSEGDAIPTRGVRGDADPNRFVNPVPVDTPIPGVIDINIIDYDKDVHRSDPNGMLIRFDVSSPNPVVEIELDLVGDGEPSIIISFKDEPRRDGRYCRALAFKPTVNGSWTLQVSAKDNQGNTAEVMGSVPVTVSP